MGNNISDNSWAFECWALKDTGKVMSQISHLNLLHWCTFLGRKIKINRTNSVSLLLFYYEAQWRFQSFLLVLSIWQVQNAHSILQYVLYIETIFKQKKRQPHFLTMQQEHGFSEMFILDDRTDWKNSQSPYSHDFGTLTLSQVWWIFDRQT